MGCKTFFLFKKRILMAICDQGWVVNFFTLKVLKYWLKIRQSVPQNKTGHSQGHFVSRTSCYRKEIKSKVSFTCVYNFILGNELTSLLVVMN